MQSSVVTAKWIKKVHEKMTKYVHSNLPFARFTEAGAAEVVMKVREEKPGFVTGMNV